MLTLKASSEEFKFLFLLVGEADVLEVFEYKFKNGKRMVAGCRCTEGSLLSKLDYKVLRNGEEVFSGKRKVFLVPWSVISSPVQYMCQ